jgi:hypothetical protein
LQLRVVKFFLNLTGFFGSLAGVFHRHSGAFLSRFSALYFSLDTFPELFSFFLG